MLNINSSIHMIQQHIITVLTTSQYARFRDLRPDQTDTNLVSYHLKLLIKNNIVKKIDSQYTLSQNGLAYVDRVNAEHMRVRTQPKIITMLLIQDGYGKVLLQRRTKQPYINTWTLPYGKIHIDDVSVVAAALRESQEKLDFIPNKPIRHVGDCYIRVSSGNEILSTTLAHICRSEVDDVSDISANDTIQWVEPLDLAALALAPAVEQIVTRTFFGDEFFFEEFSIES